VVGLEGAVVGIAAEAIIIHRRVIDVAHGLLDGTDQSLDETASWLS